MMKKVLLFIMIIAMVLSLSAVPLAANEAQEPPRIYANDISCQQGDYVYAYINAENLADLAGLELFLLYDNDIMTVNGQYAGWLVSSEIVSQNNDEENGLASFSMVSVNGVNGNGTLYEIAFRASDTAPIGEHTVYLFAGDAYDTALSPVVLKTENFKITVTEKKQAAKTVWFYESVSGSVTKGEIAEIVLYSYDVQNLAAANMEIEYDSEKFAFDSLNFGYALQNAESPISVVNSDVAGRITVSYACLGSINGYVSPFLTVRLRATANEEGNSEVNFKLNGLYDEALNAMTGQISPASIIMKKTEASPIYPKIAVSDFTGMEDTFSIYVSAEGETGLAAGDFTMTYDKSHIICTGVEKVIDGSTVISNPDMENGSVRFSFLYDGGITENCNIAKVDFKVITSGTSSISISGKNLVNDAFMPLTVSCAGGKIVASRRLIGDFTGDGVITSDDALYLLGGTLDENLYPLNQNGDLNGDGEVTSDDAIYLLWHTFLPERFPLPNN